MHKTKEPLRNWFIAAYMMATHPRGYSALQLQRHLGHKFHGVPFHVLHKLRAGTAPDKRDKLGGIYPVEIDEAFVGGKTKGKGRGVTDARLVIAAVEVRQRMKPTAVKFSPYVGRVRFQIIEGRGKEHIEPFILKNIEKGTLIRTDGWQGYSNLEKLGYVHDPLVVKGDPDLLDDHLPLVHRIFSELKTWLRGTHTSVQEHLAAYLNERSFRFNHRFEPMRAFAELLGMSVSTRGPSYRGLASGEWVHPNPPENRQAVRGFKDEE